MHIRDIITERAQDPYIRAMSELPRWYTWLVGLTKQGDFAQAASTVLADLGLGRDPKPQQINSITWETVSQLFDTYVEEMDRSHEYDPVAQRKYNITNKLMAILRRGQTFSI